MGDLVIPAGVYLQIKFESSVETFLKMLAEQLQSNAEGVFFAQQDPRAKSGCSPFHLKIVSSGNLIGHNYSKVMAILQDVGSRYDNIQGRVLPICVVDSHGVVSLKISSVDCSQIVKNITELLLGNNIWPVSNDEDLLVSIGSFNGPHTAAFEDWLNGELRSNSSVFPIFNAEFLELSESCGNFIQESVRIFRKEQKQVDSASHFKIPENENTSDKASADRGSKLSLDSSSQMFQQQSAVQRLVLSLTPITQKLVGTGMMKKDIPRGAASLQNMTRYSIIPSEVNLWQEQCTSMIRTLGNLLQSVGPKKFLRALDSVSNICHTGSLFTIFPLISSHVFSRTALHLKLSSPRCHDIENVDSIQTSSETLSSHRNEHSAALAPLLERTAGTFLEITQINDLHIEANLDVSAIDSVTGFSIPLSIIETNSPCLEGENYQTPLLSYIASGNRTVSDLRAAKATAAVPSPSPSPPPNRALIALHVRPAPLDALGLTPLHSRSVFYLPIAWIDVRGPTYLKSKSVGYSGNGRVHVSHTPLGPGLGPGSGSGQGPKGSNVPRFSGAPTPVQNTTHNAVTSPTQAVKPITGMFGDWNCPECKSLVFSFRLDCFKCRTPRPVSGPHIVPRQPQKTSSKPDGDIRDGDWLCSCCKGHNFANKLACFTCRTLRQQDPLDVKIGLSPVDPADPTSVPSASECLKVVKPMRGDWTCPSCLENVFAKRRRCYKCCTLKPR